MLSRIFNYGSIGINARFSPLNLQSETLPRELSVIGELAIRPLGTRTLEVAGGVKSKVMEAAPGQPLGDVGVEGLLPRGRVALRYQGLALLAEVEQVQTTVLDPQSFAPLRDEKAVRGSVGLQASWDFVTAGAGIHAGVSDGVDGVGFHARLHTRRRGRVYWPRRVDVERLELDEINNERSLIAMLQRIERARKAGKRSVLLVDARGIKLGWASLHELRDALIDVRNAGGHVFAYLEHANTKEYYVASAAETVYIHPAGSIEAYGIATRTFHVKRAFDKLGVKAEVIKVKEYKSAGELFSETEPSKYAREQSKALLADLYAQVLYDVARARGKSKAEARALFDDAPYGPNKAVELGLADEVVFRDQLVERMSEAIGASVEFKKIADTSPQDPTWSTTPYIAVVLVEGTIIDGKTRFIPLLNINNAGGDTIAEALRTAREDRACKGIVLRVNSPGGSALASDIIWREVQRTAKKHKDDPRGSPPIVVSMGDVAASGGYYVSSVNSTVFADPSTITGSIGVITIHFDVSGLLEKLGISTHTFKEGRNPDITSIFRSYTEDQRDRVEKDVRRTYDLFRKRVSAARGLTMEEVDKVARGRVWSGRDAKDVGLVDRFGGLYDAIALLREQGNVPKFRQLQIRVLPKQPRLIDIILDNTGDPFAGAGPVRKAVARRRARERGKALRNALPPVLNRELSRTPLSMLYLRPDRAHAIMPLYFVE